MFRYCPQSLILTLLCFRNPAGAGWGLRETSSGDWPSPEKTSSPLDPASPDPHPRAGWWQDPDRWSDGRAGGEPHPAGWLARGAIPSLPDQLTWDQHPRRFCIHCDNCCHDTNSHDIRQAQRGQAAGGDPQLCGQVRRGQALTAAEERWRWEPWELQLRHGPWRRSGLRHAQREASQDLLLLLFLVQEEKAVQGQTGEGGVTCRPAHRPQRAHILPVWAGLLWRDDRLRQRRVPHRVVPLFMCWSPPQTQREMVLSQMPRREWKDNGQGSGEVQKGEGVQQVASYLQIQPTPMKLDRFSI